jgi:predicted phage baseplate assembly protein
VPPANISDGTENLTHDGTLRVNVPNDWAPQAAGDPAANPPVPGWGLRPTGAASTDKKLWIGLRVLNATKDNQPQGEQPATITVGIDRVLFNSAVAYNALTLTAPEVIQTTINQPFQQFSLQRYPLYVPAGAKPDLTIEIGTGTPPTWQEWTLVEDLPAGPVQAYLANPVSGEIMFGNYDPRTKQGQQGHGSIPPDGCMIRATYRYVAGGSLGNVAPNTVTGFTTSVPGVSKVKNLGPGTDGSDEEQVADTLRRAPEILKTRDRAVTIDDYEVLAKQAATDVLDARCLPPRLLQPGDLSSAPWAFAGISRAPGTVNVIVVADQGPDEPRPQPTPALLTEVLEYLDQRRDLTASLAVYGPRYLPIKVTADLNIWNTAVQAGADPSQLVTDTQNLIRAYLHPTRGGASGTGWQPGKPVFAADVFRAIKPPETVAYIGSLQVKAMTPEYHLPPFKPPGTPWSDAERPFPLGDAAASVRVADYELICANDTHDITPHVVT